MCVNVQEQISSITNQSVVSLFSPSSSCLVPARFGVAVAFLHPKDDQNTSLSPFLLFSLSSDFPMGTGGQKDVWRWGASEGERESARISESRERPEFGLFPVAVSKSNAGRKERDVSPDDRMDSKSTLVVV